MNQSAPWARRPCVPETGADVARRPEGRDGSALQVAVLVAGAVTIAVLIALALTQWFGRLT